MFELRPQHFKKIEHLAQDIDHDVPIIYACFTLGRLV